MSPIQQIVRESLTTGYLSTDSENQLRQLLQTTHYGVEEVRAFASLQKAAMNGRVRQESREKVASASTSKPQITMAVLPL